MDNEIRKKLSSYLGLAAKSGSVCAGRDSSRRSIYSGKAKLVIMSEDSSDNLRSFFECLAMKTKVPFAVALSKEELGRAIGKRPCVILTVCSNDIVKVILKRALTP